MITDGKTFDTNVFFSGGAGMFIQYHDIIKPVHLYAIIKMIITKTSFGLPLNMIDKLSIFSLLEWYVKRRYKNPLQCLDYLHILDPNELDKLMSDILNNDDSLYKLSPSLNIHYLMNVYKSQHMSFPVYIYSENEESYIIQDCKQIFSGIPIQYIYGDLTKAVAKCDQNFTYILSDIEIAKKISKILIGTCSHILLAREYRYNYKDHCKTFKYDLPDMARSHPFIRIGTTTAMDMNKVVIHFKNIVLQGGNENVAN